MSQPISQSLTMSEAPFEVVFLRTNLLFLQGTPVSFLIPAIGKFLVTPDSGLSVLFWSRNY